MILGGDEIGRSQNGNNNAYCQDNETSWYDWERMDWGTVSFVQRALALRRDNPSLRWPEFPRGGATVWFSPAGTELTVDVWENEYTRALAALIEPTEESEPPDRFYLMLNASPESITFRLPSGNWELALRSGDAAVEGDVSSLQDYSIALARSKPR